MESKSSPFVSKFSKKKIYFFFHILTSLSLAPCVAVPFIDSCDVKSLVPLSEFKNLNNFFIVSKLMFFLL